MIKALNIQSVSACTTQGRKHLILHVDGTVTSSGWTHAQLSPWIYIAPPADGIWDFDLLAMPPAGQSLQVLSPIATAAVIPNPPTWLQGVRIHASAGHMQAALKPCAHAHAGPGGAQVAATAGDRDFDGDFPWPEVLRAFAGGSTVGNG